MANLRAIPEAVLARFREWGRQGGKIRARRLTKARRRQIAKLAVKAREAKRGIP